jgi:cysteine-rich repeat protein
MENRDTRDIGNARITLLLGLGLIVIVASVLALSCNGAGSRLPQDDAGSNHHNQFDGYVPDTCGNGVIEGEEVCEGSYIGDFTCADFGYTAGTVVCTNCHYDVTGCSLCGNGILEAGEACDDGNTVDDLSCSADCQSYCGDGLLDTLLGEQCDGEDIGASSCSDLGEPSCSLDCQIDFGTCCEPSCGNLIGEVCCDGYCANHLYDMMNCGDCGIACDTDITDNCEHGYCRCGQGGPCMGGRYCIDSYCQFP